MPKNKSLRLRQTLRLLGYTLALGLLLAALVLGVTGDFGLTQHWLNGVEQRALASRSTLSDRLGLRLLYGGGQLAGRMAYPQAAGLLHHYLQGSGDTLRFDARPLLQNPDVQQALRQHKPGITFRHQSSAHNPFYVVPKTNWPLYYAFDLLYIKQEKGQVVFYDKYFFQPIARRSRTRFQLGKVSFLLNDGLLNVAYPQARAFVVVGRADGTP
ncbi:MAG: hypothetical protein ACRYFX_16820 [Janthinobacterium lividum]